MSLANKDDLLLLTTVNSKLSSNLRLLTDEYLDRKWCYNIQLLVKDIL